MFAALLSGGWECSRLWVVGGAPRGAATLPTRHLKSEDLAAGTHPYHRRHHPQRAAGWKVQAELYGDLEPQMRCPFPTLLSCSSVSPILAELKLGLRYVRSDVMPPNPTYGWEKSQLPHTLKPSSSNKYMRAQVRALSAGVTCPTALLCRVRI